MAQRIDTIVIANSRVKYLLMLAVSLGFVGAGVIILRQAKDSGDTWAGWGGILFFGACAAMFIRQLLDSRPRLTIDSQGIVDRTLGVGVIPWTEINDAYIKSIRENDFICLVVRNPNLWIEMLPPVQKKMLKVNQALGFQPLNINLSGTKANTQQILELILKYSAASRSPNS